MKTGASDYTRPTTAKKMIVSPKANKTQKVKTENKHVDLAQLWDQIEETITKQKQCEMKGKYVEAEAFKRKVQALKQELEDRQMDDYRLRHQKELKELHEAHLAEMNLFQIEWQKRIQLFNQEIQRAFEELKLKHQKQFKQTEAEVQNEKKFFESPKLLQLRKIEHELGKQQNYLQAHRVQQKANKIEKEEMEKHNKLKTGKKKQQLLLLKTRQEGELQALRMRIQLQVQERERERLREQEILRQKYENILKETQFQQNQELINLNKKVRLNQLQKKSKIGGFSNSRQ